MTEGIYKRIEDQFASRMEASGLKPNSAKYRSAQADFFCGAMAAMVAFSESEPFLTAAMLNNKEVEIKSGEDLVKALYGYAMPPLWVLSLMRGDSIPAERKSLEGAYGNATGDAVNSPSSTPSVFKASTLNFSSQDVKEWDNIEIEKCVEVDGEVEVVHGDTVPDFWSVYLHHPTGGVHCVADVPTEKHANDLADLIRNAVVSFKDNGHMALVANKKLRDEMEIEFDSMEKNITGWYAFESFKSMKRTFNNHVTK